MIALSFSVQLTGFHPDAVACSYILQCGLAAPPYLGGGGDARVIRGEASPPSPIHHWMKLCYIYGAFGKILESHTK